MNRKLITGERIMYVDADTTINCVFAVKILGSFTPERLHNALSGIQAKHPLLQVIIREDEGRPYFVSDKQAPAIPVRIVERLSDNDWSTVTEEEWKQPFDVKRGPLARVVWLRSATVSDLLLVCPHCICDGASILTLMRELLMLIDQPDKTLEAYSSFDSIAALLPPAIVSDKKIILKAWVVSRLVRLVLFFKRTRKKVTTGKPYMLQWKLDEETTAAFTGLCKTKKTSLHAAFSVAALDAFRRVKGTKAHGKLICPVDIRRFIRAIAPDHLFAFAPIVELSMHKDAGADFWTKARLLKDELNRKITAMNVPELMLVSEYFHASVKKMVAFLKTSDGTHDVTLSNMGRLNIPAVYQSFEVTDIYSPSAAFPWRNPNTLVISTFRGQIKLCLLSNDAFLREAEARAIKDNIMQLLHQQLAVPQTC